MRRCVCRQADLSPCRDSLSHPLLKLDGSRFVDDGANESRFVSRIADDEFTGLGHELGRELIEHRLLDDDAFDGGATLARVAERPLCGQRRGQVEIGIPEHDKRRVASQLKAKFLVAGDCGEMFTRPGAAGKRGNPIDTRIAHPNASVIVLRSPTNVLSIADGRPASYSNSVRRIAVNGVLLDGLSSTGTPAAIAGASL
ncbi:MAG: hypothetical protein Ct9H300mP32_2200 [Verrucomicrobiota bacterium]|nr:MAG: hypothetical protein Ct9H300mP32_2200 [Verrucomicrobiota bacterium]